MSFMSRLGKGFGATLLTGSLSGGFAAALTDNFGIGLGTGIGARMMSPFAYGGFGGMWGGGYGYGGYGNGMGMGYSNFMYDMSYNNSFNTMANAAAWY